MRWYKNLNDAKKCNSKIIIINIVVIIFMIMFIIWTQYS